MSYYGGGSLPQPLATTSTPQFARLGVGTASASANAVLVQKTSSGPGIKLRTGTVNDYGYNLNLVGSNANWVAASVGTEINSSNVWTARGTAFSIIVQDNAGKWVLYTGSGLTDGSTINTASYQRLTVDGTGNIIPGTGALATNATMGFSYIETCPGTPTGVPTAATGRVPLVWDSTNDKLYAYDGGWQQVGGRTAYYERVHLSGAPRHDGNITWQVVNGSWEFSVSDTGHLIGGALQNESTKTQNDEIKKRFKVPANGTYAIRVCYVAEHSSGITTVGLGTDGSTFTSLGTFDAYQGGTDYYNHWSSELNAGALTAGTEYWLHLRVASKHASSTGYKLGLQLVDIYRTA